MKYITVKLTEDQVYALEVGIQDWIKDLSDFPELNQYEISFWKRVQTKLAKAKTSATIER